MENFSFYNPTKIIFGGGSISGIGKELKSQGIESALLLAGGGSIKTNGVYQEAAASLNDSGISVAEIWGVRPNPSLEHARQAVQLAREKDCEAIVAIGGGSVIDEAKAIAAGFYLNDVWDLYEDKPKIEKALPIFVVLTLSGTGSEFNSFSVLTNDEEKKKWAFGDKLVFPKVSFIDPNVQKSLPWNQTANGGFDAISHCLENYFRGKGDEETSLAVIESLIRSVIKNLDALKQDESDYSARASLCWASSIALSGITGSGLNGGVWATHRIEHAVSAIYPEVAHGAGLAVLFPEWIRYVQDANPKLFNRWAKEIWEEPNVDKALDIMKSKLKSWKMATTLKELGVQKDKLDEIAANALIMPGGYNVVKALKLEDIRNILEAAY